MNNVSLALPERVCKIASWSFSPSDISNPTAARASRTVVASSGAVSDGTYNNHTIRASVVKDGHREKSVTVAGIVRKP